MEPSTQSDAVLALGKRLVAQLGVDEDIDTLARWLAHSLAEKMTQVALAAPDQKAAIEREVIDLILKLWAHRRVFERDLQPFKELEPLARTLVLLNPADSKSRYFVPPNRAELQNAPAGAKLWLDRALAIDAAARDAIRYCLHTADAMTPGDAAQWAALAEAAGLKDNIEVALIRFRMLSERDEPSDGLTDAQRQIRQRLEQLSEAVRAIEEDIEQQRDRNSTAPKGDQQSCPS